MPAPETLAAFPQDAHSKTLGHVNLMVDTLIANATIEDLRAITRSLLATGTPSLAASFTAAARTRLRQTNARRIANTNGLFTTGLDGIYAAPTPELEGVLSRARSLYGAGMGHVSLQSLLLVVKATIGLRWEKEGSMADVLADIDADICQAIQSCKEELDGGRVNSAGVRETVDKLWANVEESLRDVEIWQGEFPFERAADSIKCWRI